MSSSNENIKKDLISLYTSLYYMSKNEAANNFFSRDILKKLKYNPEEVAGIFEFCNTSMEKQKSKIRSEVAEIQTTEQVLAYFKEYLLPICQPDILEEEKNNILKKVSLEEIRHLYRIVFDISLANKCKKVDAIYKIKDFFDNEERTADLTKNF